MATRRSRDFISQLYAYKGGSKPKKVKAPEVVSSFAGTNAADFNSDWGTGTSYKDAATGKLITNMNLSEPLKGINDTAQTGLQNNLNFLQLDPNERITFLRDGNDPGYNLLREESDRATTGALGRARVNAQKGGANNSTMLGGAVGTILNDDVIRQNQVLLNALNYGNENTRADAQLNLGTMGGLANLVYPLGQGANSNLLTAMNQQDAVALANAANKMQASMANAQAMNAYNQQKQAAMGSMLGSGLGLLGAGLGAIPTGGMSLLTGGLSSLSNLFNRQSTPSAPPLNGNSAFSLNPFSLALPFNPQMSLGGGSMLVQ